MSRSIAFNGTCDWEVLLDGRLFVGQILLQGRHTFTARPNVRRRGGDNPADLGCDGAVRLGKLRAGAASTSG